MADGRVSQSGAEVLSNPTPVARVTQRVIEVLTIAATPGLVTQDVVEVLSYTPSGGWRLTIDGIEQTEVVDALRMTKGLNERGRMTVVFGDHLPERYKEVVMYAPDGVTPLFGGLILQRSFEGRGQAWTTYTVSCECGDWFTYTDWTSTTVTYGTAVTLKQVLTDLVDDHLSQYGVTLASTQVTGPELEPFTWTDKRVADALRELSDRTSYVVGISPAKVLSMFIPGTIAAPFSMTEAVTNCRDLTWRDSDRTPYNTVVLRCGPDGQLEINEERHDGDGVRRRWPLNAPFVLQIGGLHLGSDAAGQDPGGFGLGYVGIDDTPWMIDFATNEIVQRADQPILTVDPTNPANTRWFKVWYHAQFPFTVRVTNGETPVIEYHESRPDVLSIPVAQGIAQALLDSFQAAPKELRIATDVDGLEPGQALTIDLPVLRQIAGTFLVTGVALVIQFDLESGRRLWRYDIEAIGSDLYQGSYLDAWRKLAGLGFGSSGSVISGDSGAGATTGADEVFVGTDEPLATTVELWFDTDAV